MSAAEIVPQWQPRPRPTRTSMVGRYAKLEPFSVEDHTTGLHAAFAEDTTGETWRYMAVGPFGDEAAFRAYAQKSMSGDDPLFFAVRDAQSGELLGQAALMRIDPTHGVIEVGSITFAPRLQRTRIATEAIYLMARRVFDELGYRRFEWKCNNLNEASKAAARRFGFGSEGVFRQHMVVKGENRDTAWFSILDGEWPARRAAFETWLAPDNFDTDGRQRQSLSKLMVEID